MRPARYCGPRRPLTPLRNVELWSWRKSTSSRFRRIAKGKPQQMAVFELDAFREDIAIV